jgi:hypothetical protein
MPTIISRVYADKKSAEAARAALAAAGFSVELLSGANAAVNAKGLGSSGVAAAAAALKGGHNLVLADAGFGKARKAAAIADGFNPMAVNGLGRDLYVMEDSRNRLTQYILLDHRRYATPLSDVSTARRGLITPAFGWKALSTKKRTNSAWSGTVRMGAFLFPLLSKKPRSNSAWSGTHRMGAFLVPLLSTRR